MKRRNRTKKRVGKLDRLPDAIEAEVEDESLEAELVDHLCWNRVDIVADKAELEKKQHVKLPIKRNPKAKTPMWLI